MCSRRALVRNVAVVAALLCAGRASAQGSGDGFLFKGPVGDLSFRGGFDRARAGSDLFSFVADELTLERRDFNAKTLVADVDIVLTPRVDLRFSAGLSRRTTPSEFRNFVDNLRQPITQTTQFVRAPLTASVKAYLASRGRSVGHFAWIPKRYAPYAGTSGGAMWYSFNQVGDFIDFATSRVFADRFTSKGWTPTVQAFVGTDVSLVPHLAVTAEGRYQWARAGLSADFSRFDPSISQDSRSPPGSRSGTESLVKLPTGRPKDDF